MRYGDFKGRVLWKLDVACEVLNWICGFMLQLCFIWKLIHCTVKIIYALCVGPTWRKKRRPFRLCPNSYTSTACCAVTGKYQFSRMLERISIAQTLTQILSPSIALPYVGWHFVRYNLYGPANGKCCYTMRGPKKYSICNKLQTFEKYTCFMPFTFRNRKSFTLSFENGASKPSYHFNHLNQQISFIDSVVCLTTGP
jgi:hypothetical protein